jgi:sulfide:quinone oxidoreductase
MTRNLLILGAGTAGTMVANRMRRVLSHDTWAITVVDRDDTHLYQPGLLLLPFGRYQPRDLVRSRHSFVADGIALLQGEVDRVDGPASTVHLEDGRALPYDFLVVATGTTPRPDQTPGMTGALWRESVFDFYTLEGAVALEKALARFDHGRLVVHVTDMPIKCPVAPLEFAFLTDAWLREKGVRDAVELVYATPLSGAFTKPIASEHLGHMLDERKIAVEPDFLVESVDEEASALVSYDERRVPFDLLVTVPLNMGADFVSRSGLGNELNYVRVDRNTLRSKDADNIFAIGDAADLPTSKAGSVAHFATETLVDNLLAAMRGQPLPSSFDGHANCFVESGDDKALLIDFNYDTEPLPGTYPLPIVGPLRLLEETRANHVGKLAFRWIYWNVLLPARPLPLPSHMSMAGKAVPTTAK